MGSDACWASGTGRQSQVVQLMLLHDATLRHCLPRQLTPWDAQQVQYDLEQQRVQQPGGATAGHLTGERASRGGVGLNCAPTVEQCLLCHPFNLLLADVLGSCSGPVEQASQRLQLATHHNDCSRPSPSCRLSLA